MPFLIYYYIIVVIGPPLLNAIWPFIYSLGQLIALFALMVPLYISELLFQAIEIFSGIAPLYQEIPERATYLIGQIASSVEMISRLEARIVQIQYMLANYDLPPFELIELEIELNQFLTSLSGQQSQLAAFRAELAALVPPQQTLLEFFFSRAPVTRALWGITLISLALCIGFSIFGVIRSIGDMQQKRPLGAVMNSTIKAMLSFLLVPLMCIVTINLTGLVLRQVNSLLMGGDGRQVSIAGAFFIKTTTYEHINPWGINAQREADEYRADALAQLERLIAMWRERGDLESHIEQRRQSGMRQVEARYWEMLESAMVRTNGEFVARELTYGVYYIAFERIAFPELPVEQARARHARLVQMYIFGERSVSLGSFRQIQADFYVYSMLASPSYWVVLISSVLMIIMLCMSVLVFLQRIYELIVLYIVAPFFVAPMPVDDGAKFKAWRDMFIGKAITGFGTLIAIQVLMIFMPIIVDPALVLHPSPTMNGLLKVLLIVGGLFAAYKANTLITQIASPQAASAEGATGGMVGGFMMSKVLNPVGTAQDLIKKGKQVGEGVASVATAPTKIGGAFMGAAKGGMAIGNNIMSNAQSLMGGSSGGGGESGGGGDDSGGGGGDGGDSGGSGNKPPDM